MLLSLQVSFVEASQKTAMTQTIAQTQTQTQTQQVAASSQMTSLAVQDLKAAEALKAEIKATLTKELKSEIEARVERERAETRLLDKIAKRVATWTPNFRFKAMDSDDEDDKKSSSTSTSTAAAAAPAAPGITIAPPAPNSCASVQCQNGGVCADGKCKCEVGFSGSRCEVRSSCDPANCLNGGKCMNNVCVCAPGWLGPVCATPDANNRCAGVVCKNGGDCQKETGACVCFGNFKGQFCEITPPPGQECLNVDCKNGNICKNGFCQCLNGFTGKYCENDPCTGVQCQNGGKCTAGKCVCAGGWAGKFCTRDPCRNTKCHNGGTCSEGKCKCTPEWEGVTCEVSMKTPAPLHIKPTMIPAWDSCSCPGATEPLNCTASLNQTNGAFMCNATVKANVTRVNETISMANVSPLFPCHTVPCQNGGTCVEGKCKCHGIWSGLLCQTDLCSTVKCQNGGLCYGGECRCQANFKGTYCEMDACQNVQCQNGGTCKWGKCQCLPDFTGDRCEDRSTVGVRRDDLSKKIEKMTKRLTRLNTTLPQVRNITSEEMIRDQVRNATNVVSEEIHKAMNGINDLYSNSYHKPPHPKKDRNGKVRWHQQTPPAVLKQRQDLVPLAKNNTLNKSFHVLHRAQELNNNASADHKEFNKTMDELSKMALTEHEASAEVELELDTEQEAETEAEVDAETDAEDLN